MPEDLTNNNFREKFEKLPPAGAEAASSQNQTEIESLEKEKAFIEHRLEDYAPQGQATPTSKDEDKVKVLKEAEKLRDIKIEGRKIEHLISLAQKHSVAFAIEVAKKTDDACLLDLFHDKLVEQKLRP